MNTTTHTIKKVRSRVFPLSEVCSDKEMREAGHSEASMKFYWKKFPSLEREFGNFDTFAAYAQSLAAGHTATSRGPCVRMGDPEGKF